MRLAPLILLAFLALLSCSDQEKKGADDGESIVILLHRRDSDDVGVFTLTTTRWTIANRSRASDATRVLRNGQADAALSYARTHLEKTIAAINRSEPGDAFRVVVRMRLANGDLRELQASAENTALFDAVLAESSPLGPVWREASGIPKTYWYREVGPIDTSNPEELPPGG